MATSRDFDMVDVATTTRSPLYRSVDLHGVSLVVNTAKGGGECLFDSVKTILASIGIEHTIPELRRMVANTVMKDTPKTNDTIKTWCQVYLDAFRENDTDILLEVAHVAKAALSDDCLSKPSRLSIADEMMRASSYGNEYALATFERTFGITFIVVVPTMHKTEVPGTQGSLGTVNVVRDTGGGTIALLLLSSVHYVPLSDGADSFVWITKTPGF